MLKEHFENYSIPYE